MEKDVVRMVLLIGLTPLIPIPFVDEYVERQLLRRLYQRLAEAQAVQLTDAALQTLVDDRSSLLLGCFALFIKWPIKKLFRTLLYFLTVKDVIDVVARSSHRVAIIKLALADGHLPERAAEVKAAMDAVLDRTDYSPLTRLIFRREKVEPEAWNTPGGAPHRTIAFLHRHGGGGLVLRSYRARLQGKP